VRAIVADSNGGPDVLRIGEFPEPTLGAGDILVAVRAAGVNRADALQRAGRYPPPPDASPILGLEAAGEVVAIAPDVTSFSVGDRVMALCNGGAYAERVVVPATQAMAVPTGLDWPRAGATPEVFLTAWQALRRHGRLSAGATALVHGAGSGVGTAAVQVARALGASVIATARSEEKLAFAAQAGARTLVTPDGVFAAGVTEITDGRGVDVICDLVGASYLAENVRSLARGGRLVFVGLLGGTRAELDLAEILARHATLIGMTIRPLTRLQKGELVADFAEWGLPRLADGSLAPLVHATLPMSAAADAHRMLEGGSVTGKIVLTCDLSPGDPLP
jgi:NADPH:quinone reductase